MAIQAYEALDGSVETADLDQALKYWRKLHGYPHNGTTEGLYVLPLGRCIMLKVSHRSYGDEPFYRDRMALFEVSPQDAIQWYAGQHIESGLPVELIEALAMQGQSKTEPIKDAIACEAMAEGPSSRLIDPTKELSPVLCWPRQIREALPEDMRPAEGTDMIKFCLSKGYLEFAEKDPNGRRYKVELKIRDWQNNLARIVAEEDRGKTPKGTGK